MQAEQKYYSEETGWVATGGEQLDGPADVVLVFGNRHLIETSRHFDTLRDLYPDAPIILASTSGEIVGTEVRDDSSVATAIQFAHTRAAVAQATLQTIDESYATGQTLAQQLAADDLVHVFVVSDGQYVNGTALAQGFNDHLPERTVLTGGLAGDGAHFEKTVVGLDELPTERRIVALGLYGQHLKVGVGSSGGWSPFGPMRKITRSMGNELFELDGKSALDLYKTYLGDQAALLPSAALRFPLCVTFNDRQRTVVRTILSISEERQSMTFAGDVPEGAYVRFMRASYEDLVDGAEQAATQSLDPELEGAELALCVSCVGRKLVLGQRIEEETEIVREALGAIPVIAGFYSYGELAPPALMQHCELHNQTMTITLLKETPA